MTILNDKIKFDAADFSGLSDSTKEALIKFALNAVPSLDGTFEEEFSLLLNRYVENVKGHSKNIVAADPVVDSILTGLASADAPTLLAAAPLLASLDALLNP